jgi:hypothetical protein
MQTDFSQIGPFLLAALVIFAIYRRLRRSFGRQPLRPASMTVRIVLLAIIGCAMLPLALKSAQFLTAELAGLALGVALGWWGSQRTRFLTLGTRLYYVPHTYTGIAVSLLFLGRLIFRALQAYAAAHAGHASAGGPAQSLASSPLTVALFFVLIGYYICFYSWVLWKSKHLDSAYIENVADPAPGK